MEGLGTFYGAPYTMSKDSRPKLIDVESLKVQFKAFKYFAFKERYEYEDEQQSKLESALKEKRKSENRLETLGDLMSGRKRLREQKTIKLLETEIDSLQKTLKFTFDRMFQRWYNDNKMRVKHPDVTKMLLFAAIIPPSTEEVERPFSLVKVICTRLRISLSQVGISKFRKLCKEDYKTILDRWLAADDTKSKKRKVRSRLRK